MAGATKDDGGGGGQVREHWLAMVESLAPALGTELVRLMGSVRQSVEANKKT